MKKFILITFSSIFLIVGSPQLIAFADAQGSVAGNPGTSAIAQAQQTLAEAKYQYCIAQSSLGTTAAQISGSPAQTQNSNCGTDPESTAVSTTSSSSNYHQASLPSQAVTTSQVTSLTLSEYSILQGGSVDIDYEVISPTALNGSSICSLLGPNSVNLSAIASKISGTDTDAIFKATIQVPNAAPNGAYSVVCSIPYNTLGQGGLYTSPTSIQVGTPVVAPSAIPSAIPSNPSQAASQPDNSGDWAKYLPTWSAAVAKAEALLNSPIAKLPAMSATIKVISGDLSFQYTSDFLMRNTLSLLNATVRLSADLTLAQAQAAPLLKKAPVTINCFKGRKSETLTGVSPKCPAGFKIKS